MFLYQVLNHHRALASTGWPQAPFLDSCQGNLPYLNLRSTSKDSNKEKKKGILVPLVGIAHNLAYPVAKRSLDMTKQFNINLHVHHRH